jgi:autotransporter-associated beta strand protein
MKSLLLPSFYLLLSVLAYDARATVYYWDPEGSAAANAANLTGTWSTTAQWSTSSSQTAGTVAWVSGYAANFSAGGTTVTTPFTVTVNSAITIGGIFNGTLSPPGCFVTLSGTGSLVLATGADAFATGGADNGTTTIAVSMTGPGQIALEGSAPIYFNAINTFSGGTSVGYAGVTAFTGIVNFNNGAAFGTGPITLTSSGTGSQMQAEGTLPITITNAFVAAGTTFNIVGNPAGLTLSGPWSLPATPLIGIGGAGNLVTISGAMSGAGGFTKYNPGTLVLSGPNVYSGGTTISNGILSVTADNNLGADPTVANYNLTLSGGTLNASNSFTLNPLRLILLTANSGIGVSSGQTLTYAGAINGAAALSKTGSGTLAVSGANGYTGITTISSGTLEADSQSGSAVGTNSVLIQGGAILSGSGLVNGAVSGTGSIAPGTPDGPGTLTLGNGLNLSGGGTYVWNLFSNSTSGGFSSISLSGGNLKLGGTSRLTINLASTASMPSTNNPFWLTQEAWPVIAINGSAGDSNLSQFTSISNGTYAAGNFTNYITGNGNITLLYQPNFPVFDTLYDSGPGFFSGENLILTNFSGLTLYTWSSTNGYLSVSNWTLVGQMAEQPLAPALPGYSRYSINVTPTVSPTYYVAGNVNTGPYIISPVPATIVTTPDFSNFTVTDTNAAISAAGVLALLPPLPVILPGSLYSSAGFQFQFTAATNEDYTVQSSADLINWINIGFGTISNSPVTFIDPAATNESYQFYRVVVP